MAMQIAALLFDEITPLDIVGPIQVLGLLPDVEVVTVGLRAGPVSDSRTRLTMMVERALEEVPGPDIVVVPGGLGIRALCGQEPVLDWVRQVHRTSRWTTSVCTGSLLLGAAGLLRGLDATTHWNSADALRASGARYLEKRVIVQGKIVTAAGVSSGIDMALHLAGLIAGPETAQAIQLMIEYDPEPPFDAGAPSKAPPEILERVRAIYAGFAAAQAG